MLKKIKDAFKGVVDYLTSLYNREDVQLQISAARESAKGICRWIKDTVKANPEAAICGGIITAVGFIAYSVLTFGFIVTCTITVVAAVMAHYYFVGQNTEATHDN